MSAPTTSILLNQTTPAPPTGDQNVTFVSDGATPQQSITAYPKRMVGDTGSGGKAGAVPPPAAGDAAASKFLKADGTWAVTPTPAGAATQAGVQQEAYTYAADTGSANAYAVTLTPVPTIVAGSEVVFKAANANTGASTLAVNGGSATAIKRNDGSSLQSGDIPVGGMMTVKYDGSVWKLPSGVGGSYSTTSFVQCPAHVSATGTSLSSAFGSNNSAGNAIVAVVYTAAHTTITVDDSQANAGWTRVFSQTFDASEQVEFWVCPNVKAGANTVTAHTTSSVQIDLDIAEYTGVALVSPVDAYNTNTATGTIGTSVNIPLSLTTTAPNDVLILIGGGPHLVVTFSPPSGYTDRNSPSFAHLCDGSAPTPGTYSTTLTLNISGSGIGGSYTEFGALIALKASGGGGSGSVTSVSATAPAWLTATVSNPTTTPAIGITAATGRPANKFLATPDGVTGAISERSIVAADLPVMVGDSGSGGTKGAVPAPAAGDAAAGKFLKADGTYQVPSAASGMANPMTTVGDLIVGSTVSGGVAAPARIAAGTSGYVLTSNGPGAAPSYQASGSTGGAVVDILSPDKPTGTLAYQKNEYATVAAGATINLLNYTGGSPGYVDFVSLILSNAAGTDPAGMTLKVYLDGSATASISVPYQNFFMSTYIIAASGASKLISSRFHTVAKGNSGTQLSAYFRIPIPFTTGIKIDLVNTTGATFTVWSNCEYQTGVANTWPYTRKLNVATNNSSGLVANSVNTLVNYTGGAKGRLVGMWLLTDGETGGVTPRGAILEGNIALYLDGAGSPNSQSSGTEDWFGLGFYFAGNGQGETGGSNTSQISPGWKDGSGEIGITYINYVNAYGTQGAFRFHSTDKRYFNTGLKLTWNCGDTSQLSFSGTCSIYSTVFYYTES